MEIKEKIEEAVAKISNDKNLQEQFQNDPVKTVKSILGADVPDEVITGIKAKLAGDKLAGAAGKLKGLF